MRQNTERRISILGALGGSIFDYYVDKGVKQLNIYAEYQYIETLTALYEQAFWLGIEIEGVYCDKETDVGINFYEKSEITQIKALDIKTAKNVISPFITIGAFKSEIFVEHYSFTELFNYSFTKRVLIDKVLNYRDKYCPNLKIIYLTTPNSLQIKNPNEWELKLSQNKATIEEKTEKLKEAFSITYSVHPYFLVSSFSTYRRNNCDFVNDFKLEDKATNIGGYRVTKNIPDNADRTIFTFGSSSCYGFGADDDHTIQSFLQKYLNSYFNEKNPYKVLNCANGGEPNYKRQQESFFYHRPNNRDIVVFINVTSYMISSTTALQLLYNNYKDKMLFVRLQEDGIFDRPHEYGEIFTNSRFHFNNTGYSILGEYLAKKMIENGIFDENAKPQASMSDSNTPEYKKIDSTPPPPVEKLIQYIQETKAAAPRIGSIVMNCNPFTLGHRYLIEQSAKKVTSLIIFVVEEDKSFFPFTDRIELVKKGTADLPNVTVVPSGGFIISQQTFGAYFEKELNKEQPIDPTNDVEIFASSIAPGLGITKRFAGEEPLDYITRQYNDTMARILPRYNIDFEVIPRKEFDGKVISASRVRELLKDKKFDEIAEIVPESTLNYLKEKFK
jgi:[citrate (pro-3S)-lyase] ligase